ncbi:hypothetical protein ACP4OV_014750 [Aristida adscensionis]
MKAGNGMDRIVVGSCKFILCDGHIVSPPLSHLLCCALLCF